jgi:tripartite-type tricarboxylate transporter receptor subunit TctC
MEPIRFLHRSVIAALVGCGGGAFAQSESQELLSLIPGKTVRMVVPYSPGGTNDVLARLLAEQLQAQAGLTIVVDYRPGANGSIGTDAVAKSAPDGRTMVLTGQATHSANPYLMSNLPYQPLRDFAPVAMLGTVTNVLVVNPAVPAKNLREFIAYLKANPGKVNFSHAGVGSSTSLATELFKQHAGVDLTLISYKGNGPAITAVIAGEVQAMFPNTVAAVPYVKADRLRALGVTSGSGDPLLPGVPTIAQVTGGNYMLNTWFGVFAPAKTPDRLVQLFNAEVNKAYERPEVKKQLAALGVVAEPMKPAAFADYVRRDNEAIGALIRSANLKPE